MADEPTTRPLQVRFETTAGPFVIQLRPEWAPRGVERFQELVGERFFDGARFFRVIEGFVAQFGIHPDPRISATWRERRIPDDPVVASNTRGRVTFATAGPGTRTTQLFVNTRDNATLDGMGFAPIGEVVEGMEVVDRLHADYGEGAPRGQGPDQGRIQREGETYLVRDFPRLDTIRSARVEVAP